MKKIVLGAVMVCAFLLIGACDVFSGCPEIAGQRTSKKTDDLFCRYTFTDRISCPSGPGNWQLIDRAYVSFSSPFYDDQEILRPHCFFSSCECVYWR